MSVYKKKKKLQEGEGRSYLVRVNVGETYTAPPRNVKHWTMGVDERGGYWTRILKAKDREDAVHSMLRWYSNQICRSKNRKNSIYRKMPRFADQVIEVSDDHNEVVYHPRIKPSECRNRLLPPDKLNEIIELGKGRFKKSTDFSKKGCFTQTREYRNKQHRERMIKIPNTPYLFKNFHTGRYHAKIQVQSKKTEGGGAKWLGCERGECGFYKRVFWEHRRGKIVQPVRWKWFLLESRVVEKAAAEAQKIRSRYEKGKTGFRKGGF